MQKPDFNLWAAALLDLIKHSSSLGEAQRALAYDLQHSFNSGAIHEKYNDDVEGEFEEVISKL